MERRGGVVPAQDFSLKTGHSVETGVALVLHYIVMRHGVLIDVLRRHRLSPHGEGLSFVADQGINLVRRSPAELGCRSPRFDSGKAAHALAVPGRYTPSQHPRFLNQ